MEKNVPVFRTVMLLLWLLSVSSSAIEINITGVVTDHRGSAQADVTVSLQKNSAVSAKTNSAGRYTLTGLASIQQLPFQKQQDCIFTVSGTAIGFTVLNNTPHIAIELYNLNGKKQSPIVKRHFATGAYTYKLFDQSTPSSVYLIGIRFNDSRRFFKLLYCREISSNTTRLLMMNSSDLPSKNTARFPDIAAVDTILVSKTGFDSRFKPIDSLTGTYDFTLIPGELPVSISTQALPVKTTLTVSHTTVSNYGINPKICVIGNSDNSFDIGLHLSQGLQIQILSFNAAGVKTGEITPSCISGAGTLLGLAKIPDDNSFVAGYSKDNTEGDKNFAYWVTRFDKTGNQIFSTQVFGDKKSDVFWSKGTPGDFSSGRIVYNTTTDKIGLYCGHTMKWDDSVRHQGGFVAFMTTAGVFDTCNGWFFSHNFDQRMIVVDSFYYALAHGDAYPRALGFSKWNDLPPKGKKLVDVQYFKIPGTVGNNATNTQTGGLAALPDGNFGVVYTTSQGRQNYDVCYKRINNKGAILDSAWLTSYPSTTFAIFSKIALFGNCILITWEEVTNKVPTVQTLVVDYSGNSLSTQKPSNAPALSPFYDLVTLPNGDILWTVLKGSDSLSVCRIKP